jgi:hypothetical protein
LARNAARWGSTAFGKNVVTTTSLVFVRDESKP